MKKSLEQWMQWLDQLQELLENLHVLGTKKLVPDAKKALKAIKELREITLEHMKIKKEVKELKEAGSKTQKKFPINKCLKCKWWKPKKKICRYEPCEECEDDDITPHYNPEKGLKICDGTCNPPECKYGCNAVPEEWNPDYKWDHK